MGYCFFKLHNHGMFYAVDYNLGFDFDLKIMNTINPKLIIYSKI